MGRGNDDDMSRDWMEGQLAAGANKLRGAP